MVITVNELGVFKSKRKGSCTLVPYNAYDITGKTLQLWRIKQVELHIPKNHVLAGWVESYNFFFKIDKLDIDTRLKEPLSPVFVLNIEVYDPHDNAETVKEDLEKALSKYNILWMDDLIDTFAQRIYYRNAETLRLEGRKMTTLERLL